MHPKEFRNSIFSLSLIFVTAAALIFFLMALAYKHLEKISELNHWSDHSMEVSLNLEQLSTAVSELEIERRNYLLTKQVKSLDRIAQLSAKIKTVYASLQELHTDNNAQAQKLGELKSFLDYKLEKAAQIKSEKTPKISIDSLQRQLLSEYAVTQKLITSINEIEKSEKVIFNDRKDSYYFAQKSTPIYLYILALLSWVVLGYSFYRIYVEVKKQKAVNNNLQLSIKTGNLAENIGKYGVWMYNFNKDQYIFSENLYRIMGFEPYSIKAERGFFVNHAHPDDAAKVEKEFNKKHTQEELLPFTFRFKRTTDHLERIMQIVARKIEIDQESVLLGISTDITEESINKLNLEKAYHQILFNNETSKEAEKIGKYGYWRWSRKKDEYFFSDNLLKIFGFSEDDMPENFTYFRGNVHPKDVIANKDIVAQLMDGTLVSDTMTQRIYRKNDGELRYLRIVMKLVENADEDFYLGIVQDITEEYLVQQLLEQNNRNLEIINKELQSFNYIASHDLQEPLRKIETFITRIEAQEADKFSENGQMYFSRMKSASKKMRQLIDDLLQFSRTSRNDYAFERADLNILMENALDELQQKIEEKNAEIHYEKLPNVSVISFQIQQLFSNLISNSLKYSKEDVSPVIHITHSFITADQDAVLTANKATGKFYKFVFTDNGIGFEEEYNDKVFDLFTRLHSKSDFEGTGIGLAICKKIIENHHGFITASGQPSEGAVFTFYLRA